MQDSRELGYGTLHMLAGLVQRQRGLAGGGLSPVYYESALFAKYCKSRLAGYYEADRLYNDHSRATEGIIQPLSLLMMSKLTFMCESGGMLLQKS